MLSLLVNSKKDSMFMAKFLLTFITKTHNFNNVELIVFTPPGEWNKDLFEYFKDYITVVDDNLNLGRGGNHAFYNEAAKHAKGDWLWYLCDDHQLLDGYDEVIIEFLSDRAINTGKPRVIIPTVDNSGWITHIFSRGWVEVIGFGQHGNVDSYTNETIETLEKLIDVDLYNKVVHHIWSPPILHDFSMDKFESVPFDEEYQVKLFKSKGMKDKIKIDAQKLREAL